MLLVISQDIGAIDAAASASLLIFADEYLASSGGDVGGDVGPEGHVIRRLEKETF